MATFIVLKNSFKNLNTVIPILFIVLNDMKKTHKMYNKLYLLECPTTCNYNLSSLKITVYTCTNYTYLKQNRCMNEQYIQVCTTCKTNSDTNISSALFFFPNWTIDIL